MEHIRVTHLSRERESWSPYYDGWFVRFAGNTEAFDAMRDELKARGRAYARWTPEYKWYDHKQGAWWIDDLVLDACAAMFSNLQEAQDAILDEGVLQWIAPRQAYTRRARPQMPVIPLYLMPDYRLLGLPSTATMQEVKAAYKSLAKQCHPDAGGSHERFIALQHSYERVLQWTKRLDVA
jgi:DnaJ-domain-containing protein 1